MANIIESRVTLEDEVFEETIDTMEEPIEVVRPSSYEDLEDLPQVNGVTLIGNKTSEELGIITATDIENAVSAEATIRENADTALDGRIDGEKTARENADTALGGRIDTEITNRTDADRALGTRIDNEILARQGGDNNLQTQIDAITSKSDVVDVVADYAALQAYDTQHLGNNDVIKVLDDETHNDAQTYYRWNKMAGTWSYIGSEAPYYSKGQIDQQMLAKQDKLTAGTGITLDGSTIGADTTILATKEDLEPEIVADLPTVGDTTKLYLTPTNKTASGNPITIDLKEDVGQMTSFRLDGDTFQQSYEGKNLFNKASVVNGIPQVSNGLIGQTTSIGRTCQFIPVMPNTAYSHTGHPAGWAVIAWYRADKSFIERTDNVTTVTSPNEAAFASVSCSRGDLDICQFEIGQPTSYEPFCGGIPAPNPSYPEQIQTVTGEQTVTINSTDYPISLGSIELCKLSTYQDYIYKDGDNWKVHKATGKYVYNNDLGENGISSSYVSMLTPVLPVVRNLAHDSGICRSNMYIPADQNGTGLSGTTGTNRIRIYTAISIADSYDAVRQLASDGNLTIYYPLATPTDTTITDQALIAQLEAVRKASLQNGTNNITNTAMGANLAGSMSIGYYGYNPSEYSEWLYVDGAWEQVGGRPIPTKTSDLLNDSGFIDESDIAPKLQTLVVDELPAVGEEGKLYLTPKDYTRSTGTGNPIEATITDGAGKIESFKLDGDTFQQTYTGKNLVNFTDLTAIGVTGHNNGDGTVTISGTATESSSVAIMNASREIKAGTYTLTISKVLPFTINLSYRGASFRIAAGSTSATTTVTSSFSSGNLWVVLTENTTYSETFGIQLTQGSTPDTDFEPFVGGQASPNPDYPQTIQTVTGEQTVEIVGKNLAKLKDGSYSWLPAGQSWNISNGVINATRPNSNYQGGAVNITTGAVAQWAVEPATDSHLTGSGGSYTITFSRSGDVQTSSSAARVCVYGFIYDANGNNTSGNGQMLVDLSTATTGTYTLNLASDRHLGALVCYSQFVSYSDVEFKVQIEKGSTASEYAPYSKQTLPINLGSIELCKLSTYQDYIYKDGNNWKVHKAINNTTLDQMDWSNETAGSGYGRRYRSTTLVGEIYQIGSNNDIADMDCSHYTIGNMNKTWTGGGQTIALHTNKSVYIYDVRFKDEQTTTAIDSWLSSAKPSLYYPLATPTDTVITDQTLIAQLEAIRTAALENGANTISNAATGANLAGDMELGYYEYDPTNRYNKWLWLDLNNNYEKLGS